MEIRKTLNGNHLTVAVDGRLDTATSPSLERELKASYGGVEKLTLDLTNLEYVSSAGLRVILAAEQEMSRKGGMTVKGVSADVMEVLEVTGFSEILVFEEEKPLKRPGQGLPVRISRAWVRSRRHRISSGRSTRYSQKR